MNSVAEFLAQPQYDVTALAQLVAIHMANGVSATRELARLTGYSERAVLKAKKELGCGTRVRNPGAEANPGAEPRCGSEPECGTPVRSSRAPIHARLETPSGLYSNLEDISNTPLPPKAPKGPTPTDALKAFTAYNETALRCALPQAAKLTPDRQRKIIARLREYGLDGWMQALANIEKSAFLTGGTDHSFRADLDFVCQAKSFGKLHDGGYGNGRHAAVKSTIALPSHLQALRDEAKAAGYAS